MKTDPIHLEREPSTQDRRSGRHKKLLFGLAAVVMGSVLTLAVVEFALRIIVPASDVALFIYAPDSLRQKVMRPNVRGYAYGVPFETNESGYRAQRPYTEKQPGVRRIIVLGDSFTACAGVPFDQLATTRLEALSIKAFPAERIEVFNLAVSGHQILHHPATLREVGLGYDPDLILLFLYPPNDFDPAVFDRERALLQEHARNEAPIPEPGEVHLIRDLYVTRAFGPLVAGMARKISFIDQLAGPSSYEQIIQIFEERSAAWQRSVAALKEIGEMANEAQAPVYTFLMPATFQTYASQQPIYAGAEAAVHEAGLRVYSLIPDFAATGRSPQDFRINLIDGHPTAEYNVFAAEKIFEELRRSGEMERLMELGDDSHMSQDMSLKEKEHTN